MIDSGRLAPKLTHKALLLVSIPLFFELIFVGYLALQLQQAEQKIQNEASSKEIIYELDRLIRVCMEAGTAMASYGVTGGSQVDMLDYERAKKEFHELLPGLKGHLQNDPEASVMLCDIEKKSLGIMEQSEKIISMVDSGMQFPALPLVFACQRLRVLMEALDKEVGGLSEREYKIASSSPAMSYREWLAVQITMGIAMLGNIGLAIGLTTWVNRSTARRTAVLLDNTVRLAEGRELRPEVAGSDEIAHLDRTFRRMAETLAASRRKEQGVIEHAQDVLCSLDRNGRFTTVSAASFKVWGYFPEEIVGAPLSMILADEETVRINSFVQNLTGTDRSDEFECTVDRKDGARIHSLWSVRWSAEDQLLICVARDITERKNNELELQSSRERLTQILNGMPVGLLVLGPDGRIESSNSTVQEMLDYDQTELAGKHLSEIIDANKGTFADRQSLFVYEYGRTMESQAKTRSGRTVTFDFTVSRFSINEKTLFLAILVDIKQRLEIERMKQEFVSIVSHDLRTPLTSIQAYLTMLIEGMYGQMSETGQAHIADAEKQAAGLGTLINNLLDIERLEAGLARLKFDNVSIQQIIKRAAESVQELACRMQITLTVDSPPVEIVADFDRLVQVMVNLLANAIAASRPGTVVSIAVADRIDALEIKVTDQGCGIPDQYHDSIFERFRQVEESVKRGGIGLGLPLCKAIIKEHKGMIGIDSKTGIGSTFWIHLPRANRENS